MPSEIPPDIPSAESKYNSILKLASEPREEIGVFMDKNDAEAIVFIDILRQEGFFHDVFDVNVIASLPSLPSLSIILGPVELGRKAIRRLKEHVESGKALMSIGFNPELEGILGIIFRYTLLDFPVGGKGKKNSIGEGYLEPVSDWLLNVVPPSWYPLHGFGCAPALEDESNILARYNTVHGDPEDEWIGISLARVGSGWAMHFGPDIVGTIRRIREGRFVDEDGIPPPDGMSPVDDDILKAEDGINLDWTRDRRKFTGNFKVPAFLVPVCDAWTRLLGACAVHLSDLCAIKIKKAGHWPGDAPFVAHLSHDTDGNDERLARLLLSEINSRGIKTTWCLQPPGYSRELCDEIASHGHELALHFDAIAYPDQRMKDAATQDLMFSPEMLAEQFKLVKERARVKGFYTNKNHYTRWAGKNDFFRWCESLGIRVDQSKGPSKCGTMGFPFGTAHPWQVPDGQGRLVGCLEISFQSQDFGLQGPPDVAPDLLDAVKAVGGVAHVIFHPAHSGKPKVNQLMHEFIDRAFQMGAIFMTSREIGEWTFDRKYFLATGYKTPSLSSMVIKKRVGRTWQMVNAGEENAEEKDEKKEGS